MYDGGDANCPISFQKQRGPGVNKGCTFWRVADIILAG